MSEVYRGENGEIIEVRYLDIPDRPTAPNGLPLVDEIVCGPMHLETLDDNALYLRVAGLMVNVWAHGGRKAQLSVTVEPDGCERVSGGEGTSAVAGGEDSNPRLPANMTGALPD